MPNFAFTARDSAGAALSGILSAASIAEVTKQLRAEGKYPTSIRPAGSAGSGSAAPAGTGAGVGAGVGGIKLPRAEVISICMQLSVMIETGVTISEALECIASQCSNVKAKALVEDLAQQVQEGSDFSSALNRHPRAFPRLFIALIKASEKSGMLAKLLTRGATYMREEQETIRKVRGALIYPACMLSFAVTTTIFLLAFVLPKFTVIYASKAAALPLPTKVLMTISDFIVGQWIGLVLGLVGTVVLVAYGVRTKRGLRIWHFLQLNVPLLGPMFRKVYLSRSLRMLGTMGTAGVNLVDSVSTTHDLCANGYFRDLWNEVSEQIQAGKQLSEPLFRSKLVPRSIAQMLHSGEKGGKLSHVMEQVAGYSETELKEKITELTRYIEPIMIVVMGIIIGGVALALLLPIFTISRVMAQ